MDAYLTALYPPASNHLLPIEALQQPNVVFLTARLAVGKRGLGAWRLVFGASRLWRVVGCGALVNYGDYAEIKRMFVRPACRGLRIGELGATDGK